MKAIPDVEDEEEITKAILEAVSEAAANLEKMRAVEGEKLAEDLIAKGEHVKEILDQIAERAPQVVVDYTAKLKERIQELVGSSVQVPEDRILVEAAVFADKCAIDEEITRLNSHLIQLKTIIGEKEQPVGKKLDFLVQEIRRIGLKAGVERAHHRGQVLCENRFLKECHVENITIVNAMGHSFFFPFSSLDIISAYIAV